MCIDKCYWSQEKQLWKVAKFTIQCLQLRTCAQEKDAWKCIKDINEGYDEKDTSEIHEFERH